MSIRYISLTLMFVLYCNLATADSYIVPSELFFDRWERADLVAEGTISDIKSYDGLLGQEFSFIPKSDYRKAKFNISKVWKGSKKQGTVDIYFVDQLSKNIKEKYDLRVAGRSFTYQNDKKVLLYLRNRNGKMISSIRFGLVTENLAEDFGAEKKSIEALLKGVKDEEIVPLLPNYDNYMYEQKLKKGEKLR